MNEFEAATVYAPDRASGTAIDLRHVHLWPNRNTLGWPGRALAGTSHYERDLIRLWAEATGPEHCYIRRTRHLWTSDEVFGNYRDTCLLVMIARAEDYHEFVAVLDAIPPRSVKREYAGKLSQEEARALRGRNFRILRTERASILSVEEGVF